MFALTRKVDLHTIFSLISLVKKEGKSTFLVKFIATIENCYFPPQSTVQIHTNYQHKKIGDLLIANGVCTILPKYALIHSVSFHILYFC